VSESLRLDKFLVQARFFKTRAMAAQLIAARRVRLDGTPVMKPSQAVKPGDVLTFPQGRAIRVVRISALPARRGPPAEARGCYDDLSPPVPSPPLD
jgi:ribosome-associated heat shock protein Hsp15